MIYFEKGTYSDTLLTKCCKFTINTCPYSPVFGYAVLINPSSNDLTWILNLCLCKDKTLLYRDTWFSCKYYLKLERVWPHWHHMVTCLNMRLHWHYCAFQPWDISTARCWKHTVNLYPVAITEHSVSSKILAVFLCEQGVLLRSLPTARPKAHLHRQAMLCLPGSKAAFK